MQTDDPTLPHDPSGEIMEELACLRNWTGPIKEFWPRYAAALARFSNACRSVLLFHRPDGWRKLAEWSANTGPSQHQVAFTVQLADIGERCLQGGQLVYPLEQKASGTPGPYVVAVRQKLLHAEETCVAAFLLSDVTEETARETLLRLSLLADTPEMYQIRQANRQAKADVEKFASVLDLLTMVNSETRFMAAALALCNGAATRFKCDRVSLGWLEGGYVKLKAISRTEKFDRQMDAARHLEMAMEEALDQDEEVACPPREGPSLVTRDHEIYAREQACGHVLSLPLRVEGKAVAVLTCERQEPAFSPLEMQQLRLCCDQSSRRLSDLKRSDRWFGARLATVTKEKLARLVGPEHTWAKVLSILIVAALAVLFLVPVNYRVEGNFIVRSEEVAFMTAPFNGFINEVLVRPGDVVTDGRPLLRLDTDELQLQHSAAVADLNRYLREAEKARAGNQLAEMRVATALADQAQAQLDMIRYRLAQAEIHSPFEGVVVEGDLREFLNAPVRQGDPLVKVSRLENLYVEVEVKERDIHEVLNSGRGEIAFVSQPKLKFPVQVVAVEPAAAPKAEGNMFIVRCAFDGPIESWWRPGMSGLCKLEIEKRTLFWILTHRTVDFLRMVFWW